MSLESLCKELNKKTKDTIIQFGATDFGEVDVIPFSSPRANYSVYGGIPRGRIIEFFGDNGSGKTTSALDICKNAQKIFKEENPDNPKKILFIDAENTYDIRWANTLGVDSDSIVFLKPKAQSAEEIFDFTVQAMDTGEVGLVILDSIGVLLSQQAFDKDIADRTYGGISMPLTVFSKKAEMLCHKHNCTFIGINQVRDNLNSMYGGLTTTGGHAWQHMCSMRLQFKRGDFFDEKLGKVSTTAENPAGNNVQFSVIKSKCFPNDRKTGFYRLHYYKGILSIEDTVDLAIKKGYVVQGGAWYTIVDPDTGEMIEKYQGISKVVDYMKEHTEFFEKLKKLCEEE